MRNELKAKRALFGLTAAQAAEMIGKSVASYSKKENGMILFTPGEMVLLADKLEMTQEEFNRIFFGGKLRFKG